MLSGEPLHDSTVILACRTFSTIRMPLQLNWVIRKTSPRLQRG
jgi:hypothetical protein